MCGYFSAPVLSLVKLSHTTVTLNIPPENINEHSADIRSVFISDADQANRHLPKGLDKTWLGTITWRQIDERKGLCALLMAAVELHYRDEVGEVHRNVRHNENNSTIILVQETETPANNNDCAKSTRFVSFLAKGGSVINHNIP